MNRNRSIFAAVLIGVLGLGAFILFHPVDEIAGQTAEVSRGRAVSFQVSIPGSSVPRVVGTVPANRRLVLRDFVSIRSIDGGLRSNWLDVRADGVVIAQIPITADTSAEYFATHFSAGIPVEEGQELSLSAPQTGGSLTIAGVLE